VGNIVSVGNKVQPATGSSPQHAENLCFLSPLGTAFNGKMAETSHSLASTCYLIFGLTVSPAGRINCHHTGGGT